VSRWLADISAKTMIRHADVVSFAEAVGERRAADLLQRSLHGRCAFGQRRRGPELAVRSATAVAVLAPIVPT
jgi:hypothetical protein